MRMHWTKNDDWYKRAFTYKSLEEYQSFLELMHLLNYGFPGKLNVLEIHQYAWQESFIVRYKDLTTNMVNEISSEDLLALDMMELCRTVKMDVEEISKNEALQDQYCDLRDDIMKTLEVLEIQFWNLLQIARCRGGTLGHKVGGNWKKMRKLREFMKQYL